MFNTLQKQLGGYVMGMEYGAGLMKTRHATHHALGLNPETLKQTPSGYSLMNKVENSTIAGHSIGERFNLNNRMGSAAQIGRQGALNFANKINQHLVKQGRGIAGGFHSVGSLMSRMPMKQLGKSYAGGTALMFGIETTFMGKPANLQTLSQVAMDNIPLTIGMELAGGGMKGLLKHGGYQALGEYAGLGPWGSLGLQVAGSTYLPGLGMAMGGAIVGYEAGKGMYNLHKKMYQLGKGVRKTEFDTGDRSYATAEAATMRQRSIAAIQKSHMNTRSMLGREATIMMGR